MVTNAMTLYSEYLYAPSRNRKLKYVNPCPSLLDSQKNVSQPLE